MRHTEQEGGREEEVMLAAELATGAYRKSEMMRSGATGKKMCFCVSFFLIQMNN